MFTKLFFNYKNFSQLTNKSKRFFDLHEYQSKNIMGKFGIRVQKGDVMKIKIQERTSNIFIYYFLQKKLYFIIFTSKKNNRPLAPSPLYVFVSQQQFFFFLHNQLQYLYLNLPCHLIS